MPLAAAQKESVKIKLPGGFYMYSSSMEKLQVMGKRKREEKGGRP